MYHSRSLLPGSLIVALLAMLPACAVTLSPGQSIQAAIAAAASGDVIVLNPGLYPECLDFLGKDLVLRSTDPTNPVTVAATIIDGGAAGRVVSFENGETANALLKGVTIRNGGGAGVIGGGGIFIHNSSPKILNCLIIGNLLNAGSGGGILVNGGAPTIVGNIIRGNSSPVSGGGVCFTGGATGLFQENSVMQNAGVDGGGLALYGSTPDVRKNSIQKNSASSGGGVYLSSAAAQLRYNSLHRNSAAMGGAVYASASAWRLANCLLTDNTSTSGGAVQSSGGTISLTSNTFVDNSCAVYTDGSGGTITNCIITDSTGWGVQSVGATRPSMSYTDLWSNAGGDYTGVTTANGIMLLDPLYVSPANDLYNLKSRAGHYAGAWVNDAVTSPCVDAGSPWLTATLEPAPNGARINMGFEGNTEQASKSIGALVSSVSPANGATGVSRRPQIVVNFQRPVDQASAESHFDLYSGPTNPDGTFSWPVPNRRLIYTPVVLGAGAPWTISVSSGVKLWDGTTTALPFSSSFMSGDRPVVLGAAPTGASVARGANIVVTFDVPMGHGTTTRAFHISPAAAGTFRWAFASQRLIFDPSAPLAAATTYRVTVDGTAKSMAGLAMNWAYAWSFTTAAAVPLHVSAAAAGGTQIAASLSEPAAVTVTISNLAGRVVAELSPRQCPAGVTTLLWNGRSAGGALAPGGTYLVQVRACSASGASSSCLLTLQR